MKTPEDMKQYMGWKIDFSNPPGAPAFNGPDSVSWRVLKNPVSKAIGGICAVLLEFADPRIRSGVWDHSTFKKDPLGRAARTNMASLIGTYGPQQTARDVIGKITKMHARVTGETPNGEAYQALDEDLLDWVSATASYGFMMAYDRYVSPLSESEKVAFYREGADVASLYGVKNRVGSPADFDAMLNHLLPRFEPHPINSEFLDIVRTRGDATGLLRRVQKDIANAAVELLPTEVRERLQLGSEFDLGIRGKAFVKTMAWFAETFPQTSKPPALACERLGLPRNFLWLNKKTQAKLLAELNAMVARTS